MSLLLLFPCSVQECNDVESSTRKSQFPSDIYEPGSGRFLSLNWLVVDDDDDGDDENEGGPLPSLVKGCGS